MIFRIAYSREQWLTALALFVGTVFSASAQPAPAPRPRPAARALDSVLTDVHHQVYVGHSRHFVLYARRGDPGAVPETRALLDSLEAAWAHDAAMIGAAVPDDPPVMVIVTSARTGKYALLGPEAKGLTTRTRDGRDVVILVHNDSVRAYTRHEVMHVISRRVWGSAAPAATWLVEGLAAFADGQCQNTSVAAVARDILLEQPQLTARDVTTRFLDLLHRDRAEAYVLAASYAGYLWNARGRDGVRRVWRGLDSADTPEQRVSAVGFTLVEDPTTEWRLYVKREAGSRPGLSASAFHQAGCG